MTAPKIYALHGFLGLPSDWDFLKSDFDVQAENLWTTDTSLSPVNWAEKKLTELSSSLPGPRVLLGYSMGGRLAMHILLALPRFWDAAILVSAHPGVSSIDERAARRDVDFKWAQKFLKDDWSSLMNAWNKQALFSRDKAALPRNEKDFDRAKLASALENWSLTKQDNLAMPLAKVSIPILWMAGEQDEKYSGLLSGFPKVAKSHQYTQIANAGHRVPWDNPAEFTLSIKKFLKLT